MESNCKECGGKAFPVATNEVRFKMLGVGATYVMECDKCKRRWIGRFFFPLDEENYVGEVEE